MQIIHAYRQNPVRMNESCNGVIRCLQRRSFGFFHEIGWYRPEGKPDLRTGQVIPIPGGRNFHQSPEPYCVEIFRRGLITFRRNRQESVTHREEYHPRDTAIPAKGGDSIVPGVSTTARFGVSDLRIATFHRRLGSPAIEETPRIIPQKIWNVETIPWA